MNRRQEILYLFASLFVAGSMQAAPAAQETVPTGKPDGIAGDKPREDRGSRQVLHLASGGVLRERARFVVDHWEIRTGKHWTPLAVDAVTRAKGERELLKQADELDRKATGGDVHRAAYADWLGREGLYGEAFSVLDKILERDPANAAALGTLSRIPIRVRMPDPRAGSESLNEFLSVASKFGPAARERALQVLAEEPAIAELAARVQSDLETKSRRRRAFALHVMRGVFPGHNLRTLLGHAVLDSDEGVRIAASQALGRYEDPAVIVPIVRALGSKHHAVRTNAAQSLGAMNYAAAVEPLIAHLTTNLATALQSGGAPRPPRAYVSFTRQLAYIQDFDVEVATNSSIADPVIGVLSDGVVLDAAVRGITVYQLQDERSAVRRALSRLTGASPGHTTAAWGAWWNEHGEEWRTPPTSSPTSPDR